MLLKINADNPQERLLQQAAQVLQEGGVIIYPTDTVYGMGCDIRNKTAIERICRIKQVDVAKEHFACICAEVAIISDYAIQVSTPIYKLMRNALPGPYTFILKASKNIPRHFQSRRKTVGIRVPAHHIPRRLVQLLGNPMLTTSLPDEPEGIAQTSDPELIYERYHKLVDVVIDGGAGGLLPSTIIDCSGGEGQIAVLREGAGSLSALNLLVHED